MSRSFDVVRSAVRREFTEWPTVSLTLQQACRYWGIEPTVCAPLLEGLVAEGFLVTPGRRAIFSGAAWLRRDAGNASPRRTRP